MKILKIIIGIGMLFLFAFIFHYDRTDVNRDGTTDMKDLVIVKKKIMEMESEIYEH